MNSTVSEVTLRGAIECRFSKAWKSSCPACSQFVEFEAVYSVNADRRPDLRDEILAGTFQKEACPKCGESFRLTPELTYLDEERGQWIAAFPADRMK